MPRTSNYPEVYIDETPGGVRTIAGVDTSITAFAGWAPTGPVARADLVVSWVDFESKFGGLDERSLLGYSVDQYFNNGGRKAYILRLGADESEDAVVLQPNEPDFENALLPADGIGGLYHLDGIDLFNLLCVPGETNAETVTKLQKFCRDRRAFLIADCAEAAEFDDLKAGPGIIAGTDSINSAFYFPWVLAADKLQQNQAREFPPCGFIAGVYARTDATRGVWKAPAGTEASLTGVSGVAPGKTVTDNQNSVLNPVAINCIRTFTGRGTVVWGARTLDGADERGSEWKYVPVRRTALFIEESLDRGLKWVVFEPNDESLWAQIRLNVGAFMHDLFRKGAFQGLTPKDAYFVKCDAATKSQNDIDSGRVNVVVGFAPLKPAEFVIIKLHLMAARKEDGAARHPSELKENIMAESRVNPRRTDPYQNFNFRVELIVPSAKRDEIVLPEKDLAVLDRIIEDVVDSDAVYDQPDLGRSALFHGEKGSGRARAAEAIAERMGLDLYRIDLSPVASEYVGETEKNLQQIFDTAEKTGAVMFFDEADALFGKRSEVKDSHDRYANLEVNYLLERLERFPGLAILATNMKQNIDEAFLRRLRFIIDFPPPRS